MPEKTFAWDSANIEHVARHCVSPEEAEQVVENNPIDLPVQIRNGEERLPHLGTTDDGRVLVVVTVDRDQMVRVVTAFPADRDMRKYHATVMASRRKQKEYRMPKKIETPNFKNEAEEADWWPENPAVLLAAFKEAEKDGTLGEGTLKKRGLTPTTTIRLDPEDIELAKAQAAERGLKYQTYLKSIIHQALRKTA